LQRAGFAPDWERVQTAADLQAALDRRAWEVVIFDYRMPCFSAPAALEIIQASRYDLPFILVSGTIGEGTAVAMMKAGAHDYLMI